MSDPMRLYVHSAEMKNGKVCLWMKPLIFEEMAGRRNMEHGWEMLPVRSARMGSNMVQVRLLAVVIMSMPFHIEVHAQRTRPMVLMQLGTDAYALAATGTMNTTALLRTQGWGVGVSLTYHYAEWRQQYFSVEHERSSVTYFAGRYFALHGPKTRGGGMVACPAWGPQRRGNRRSPLVDGLHGAVYLHAGYRKERWTYDHAGLVETIAAGTAYTFVVHNNGALVRTGYAARWWRLFMEVGANAFLSFPRAEGRIDPFGDSLYTGIRPFRYRFQIVPDVHVGFQIPLIKP